MAISSGLAGAVGAVPPGALMPYAGSTAPSGWLLCAGQTVSRSQYSGLFAVINTTYGAGDGSTTFALPDLRGRVVAGIDNMGGTNANRLSATTIIGAANNLGRVGGAETHLLGSNESGVPAHGHPASSGNDSPDHTHQQKIQADPIYIWSASTGGGASFGLAGTEATSGASARHTHSITVNNNTAANAAQAHNNVQPTMVLNYIIKAA